MGKTLHKPIKRTRWSKSVTARTIRTALIRRGTTLIKRIETNCGPTFSSGEVAARIGVRVTKVKTMFARGLLLGFRSKGTLQFPAWQFDGTEIRFWVAPVIEALGSQAAALHYIAVPRKSLGTVKGCYQSFLAKILANDPAVPDDMVRLVRALGHH